MKPIAVALAALLTATGASAFSSADVDAFFPLDIENNAQWVVLDSLAMPAGHAQAAAAIIDLRTTEPAGEGPGIAAVCGTIDFRDDEGATNFVVFYARGGAGRAPTVSPPFFYGTEASLASIDPQGRVAQAVCGGTSPGQILSAGAPR